MLGREPETQTWLGALMLDVHPTSTGLGMRTWAVLPWRCLGGMDGMGRLHRDTQQPAQPCKVRRTQMPGGSRVSPCAAGRSRWRMPAPLSYFPG